MCCNDGAPANGSVWGQTATGHRRVMRSKIGTATSTAEAAGSPESDDTDDQDPDTSEWERTHLVASGHE